MQVNVHHSMAQNYNLVKITQVENATISTQILNYNYAEQFLVITPLIYQTKTLFSIYKFSSLHHFESLPMCIARYWL